MEVALCGPSSRKFAPQPKGCHPPGLRVLSVTVTPSQETPYHLTGLQRTAVSGGSSKLHLVLENGLHMKIGNSSKVLLHPDASMMVGKTFKTIHRHFELRPEDEFLECFSRLDQTALVAGLWTPHTLVFMDGTEFPVVECALEPDMDTSVLNLVYYQLLDEVSYQIHPLFDE